MIWCTSKGYFYCFIICQVKLLDGETEAEKAIKMGSERLAARGQSCTGAVETGDGQKKGQTRPLPSHSLSILSHSSRLLHQLTSDFNMCPHAVINSSG